MLRQDFTVNSLLRVTTKNEIIKFDLGRDKDEYKKNLEQYSSSINSSSFKIENVKITKINSKPVFYTDLPEEHYCIKKISSDMKRLYKIRTINRDDISEQVLRILETSSDYGIIRVDIKSFYESISYESILGKLKADKLLASKSLGFLNDLLALKSQGLPRGLSVSPILSEIFMRNIDFKIREIPGVYYYSRYVDDIFIFTSKEYSLVEEKLTSLLREYDLKTNNKTFVHNIPRVCISSKFEVSFDYLGYKYIVTSNMYDKKRVVSVVLSDDKVRKIKTRIVHSLIDRAMTKNSTTYHKDLLEKRLDVLSGNYPISSSKGRTGELKGGIFYSNRLVNKSGVFEEFNDFLRRSLYSKKNNFFGRAMRNIPSSEKLNLRNVCFKNGFVNKKYISLTDKEMSTIKRCWENKNHKKKV
ncbi:RNA-directed DNA polymerase [Vibrio gigantis]|uniref:antiviral reverse transcriptase Drt3a n=1 Tax=Vibrio gigantis TaxID=296199 RepID=UPI002FC6969D